MKNANVNPELNEKSEEVVTERQSNKNYKMNDIYHINIEKEMNNITISKKASLNDPNNLTKWKLFRILIIKLIFSLLYLLISLIIQGFFMIYSDSYYKRYTPPLGDRIHDLFEYPPKWASYNLSNNLIAILTVFVFFRLIIFNSVYLSIAIACRFLYMLGSFYILRGILIYVTSLPATLDTCLPLESGSFRFNLLQILKINMNLVYVCSDLIISGHSFSTTLLLMFSLYYMNNVILKIILSLFCCFIYIFIIIGFIHYTSDVLLGLFFGVFIFSFYHIMLDLSSQYYIFCTLFEVKIISNKKNVQAKPFFLRFFLARIFLKIIPFLEGLNYTLNYALNKNNDFSTFCNCENYDKERNLISFCKSSKENKISIYCSDHLFHSYAGDGTISFLSLKFVKMLKVK
ncbi:sphingomyelin synthase 2, putative [Plasmodium gallinaceum]|uniref:Sphingomyelin synthase 2, putative n=1 Tax=Plasmodium gallinaceum TaxID=5849 RepID=A0A1J1GS11_PLAGA|nr:sphingomyelin synthase 2, putative [Plasmodium gallinaceum]CRG93827.1 sphingomyelin synthase 2, putative [Plasmodium gallinaceum]